MSLINSMLDLASYPGSLRGREEHGNHCMCMCQSYYKNMVSQKSPLQWARKQGRPPVSYPNGPYSCKDVTEIHLKRQRLTTISRYHIDTDIKTSMSMVILKHKPFTIKALKTL